MILVFSFNKVFVFFHLFLLFAIFSLYGQTNKEIVLVLEVISNKTTKSEYDKLSMMLYETLESHPLFPETILDSLIIVDTIPGESVIIRARNQGALYILWGSIDTSEHGLNVTLKIFDMHRASTSHISLMINGDEKTEEIADILRSKLLMWLQRTTMVHLIISTTPGVATVLLDNKEIGFTPFEGMVQPGTFSLELTKRSFSPIKIPVSFISGNTYQYDITLGKSDSAHFKDKRAVIRLLTVSLLCAGAGIGAHCFQERSMRDYRTALPPSDFNNLYRRAVCWNTARNTLLATAGVTICGMIFKMVL